jgi:hypothetical protein
LWADLRQRAESTHRFGRRDVAGDALRDEPLHAHGEVEGDLLIGFGFDTTASA